MATKNIIQATNNNFTQEIDNSATPVLVDFWAPWCGPCRAVSPILEQLADKYAEKIKIGKVNVDEEPALASKFRVANIPTLIMFKNGQVLEKMVGLRSVKELENLIEKAL